MKYKVIISESEIRKRVEELGKQISLDFSNKKVILTGVLKGAYIFMSDLSRAISIPHTIDFMAVSSYGSSTSSSGVVRILKDFDFPITNKHIILIEDIIDSGLTLKYLVNMLKSRSPASLSVCALLDKKNKHPGEILADYVGFDIPDEFVVGYGLDYDQYYRNLPFIAHFDDLEG